MEAGSFEEKPMSEQRRAALSWSAEEIENAWKQILKIKPNGSCVTGCPYPASQPSAYVRFGHPIEWRQAEARNQIFVQDALQRLQPGAEPACHAPEVYRTMKIGDLFFIIMEFVPGKTLAQIMEDSESWKLRREEVTDKIYHAIKLLMSLPVPRDAKPGPVGGGHIRHPLFKDCEASIEYNSVDILERHLNKVNAPPVPEEGPY